MIIKFARRFFLQQIHSSSMGIVIETGNLCKNVYHFDTRQFGLNRVTSSFYYWDGETCILIDVGTSDEVRNLLKHLKEMKIPLNKVKGIILSHYHFDHGGGATKLYSKIIKKNPDFKIYTPKDTFNKLQNAQDHLKGAKTTFGNFIGTMNPAPEDAYVIVNKDETLPFEFSEKSSDYKIKLISTPGHSKDHCSPTVFKGDRTVFTFAGEACGTLFHGSKLVSLPTSMPPNFNYSTYINSIKKIRGLKPESLGFCHFGAIKSEPESDYVMQYIGEHLNYIEEFRNKIVELFKINPSTRYVIENMPASLWGDRVDPFLKRNGSGKFYFKNLQVALTYGMMVDLGFRKPKYEKKMA